jgi:hypothetical protein
MKSTGSILALAAWGFSLGACVTAATPPQAAAEPALAGEQAPSAVHSEPVAPPAADNPGGNPGEPKPNPTQRACHLPAAKKSADACKSDADCGPSDPCHAQACVAKAKSKPKTPDTMCTMMMSCDTADANRCGCFEGRCALIPPDDAAKE